MARLRGKLPFCSQRETNPEAEFLKLRYSTIGEINRAKTQEIIITRRVGEGFTATPVRRYSSIPH